MRLGNPTVTDHDLLTDVGLGDHHVSAVTGRILVNSLSIPPGNYDLTVALGKSGCKSITAILRGTYNVDIQGHVGVYCLGTNAVLESCAMDIRPYPSGTASYVGGYSRLHADNFLSHDNFGEGWIRLGDVFISGTNGVFRFYNEAIVNKNLTVYGSWAVK